MPNPEETREIVAAILTASWFQQQEHQNGATTEKDYVHQYLKMLDVLKNPHAN